MERLFFRLVRLSLLLTGLFAAPALAGPAAMATAEGGTVRLLALPADGAGRVKAVLDITLAEGWMTYWREPGDSGIPPSVTPQGGARLVSIGFPPPRRFAIGELRDYGYDKRVLLPLDLVVPPGAESLSLSVFLGICRDICIPFSAELAAALATPDPAAPLTRRLAEAQLPQGPAADFRLDSASRQGAAVRLTLTLPKGAVAPQLILTGKPGELYDAPADSRREGDRLTVTLPVAEDFRPGPETRLLVTAGPRSLETGLAFD